MIIRTVQEKDAKEVSQLSGQLGYPSSVEKTIETIRRINADNYQIIFVAELDGTVVGWIQLQKKFLLIAEPFTEIVGLIVDEKHRGKSIGRSLVQECIRWTKQENIHKIRVKSNITRDESHEFYKTIGFREVKTQKVYDREVE
ncbi:MAG TPA: GNAT family N-acetyltransferase [Chitinophagaceae bacterium]|jgi:predicted N-acetyltransferase YhbS|nr:GNAT family N-acetyltransferase [Chitinophagaceae bacterium]